MHILERAYLELCAMRAPLDDVLNAFDTYPPMRVRSQVTPRGFPGQEPYHTYRDNPPPLLWSPASSPALTAFMRSATEGGHFVTGYAGTTFGFSLCCIRSTIPDYGSPINEFEAHADGRRIRLVRAMKEDPRWDFWQDGTPLPFEETTRYTARLKRDRLDRALLLDYLEAWGAPVRSPAFWTTNARACTFVLNEPTGL